MSSQKCAVSQTDPHNPLQVMPPRLSEVNPVTKWGRRAIPQTKAQLAGHGSPVELHACRAKTSRLPVSESFSHRLPCLQRCFHFVLVLHQCLEALGHFLSLQLGVLIRVLLLGNIGLPDHATRRPPQGGGRVAWSGRAMLPGKRT